MVDYIKRTTVVDVFHPGTGLWYVGTIARVVDGDDGGTILTVHFPHHESEQLVWEKGMYNYVTSEVQISLIQNNSQCR